LNRFNIVKQSKDYDQNGDYVRRWLPELKEVPTEFVHEPWRMTQFQQTEFNVQLGVDYPNPIIPPSKQSHGNTTDQGARGNDGRSKNQGKQRRPNNNAKQNQHQKFEMKSVKKGSYTMR
jgi:deoxyribodipyrimidine photo-lyase